MPQQAIASKPPVDASLQNLVVRQTLVAERVVAQSIATNILDVNRIQIQGIPFTENSASSETTPSSSSSSVPPPVPGVLDTIVTLTGTGGLQSSGSTLAVGTGILNLTSNAGELQMGSTTILKVNSTNSSIALGPNAGGANSASSERNVTIGSNAGSAITTGDDNVAIGFGSTIADATSSQGVVVGAGSRVGNAQSIVIGAGSDSGDGVNIVLGANTQCQDGPASSNNIMIGNNSQIIALSGATQSIVIGNNIPLNNAGMSVTIGSSSTAGAQSVNIGTGSACFVTNSVGLGANSVCTDQKSVSIGRFAENQAANCVSMGRQAFVGNAPGCIALGNNTEIPSASVESVVIGINSLLANPVTRCFVLGPNITAGLADNDTLLLNVEVIAGPPPQPVSDSFPIRIGTGTYPGVYYAALSPQV